MPADHPVILFDGECNLCNSSVDFVVERDPDGVFKLGSLQSEAGRRLMERHGLDPEAMDSIVLIDGDEVYRESDAALRIARKMSGAWPLLSVFRVVPAFIRDAVYRWIARNRYRWFGKRDTCRVPSPDEQSRFID